MVKVSENIKNFIKNRFYEIFGLILIVLSVLLFATLITYSPNDPNFIEKSTDKIQNILGLYGSISSDFLLQSFGLISYLLVFNILNLGLNFFFKKNKNVLQKFFLIIVYLLCGTAAINILYNNSFLLIYNGNGGFLGEEIKRIIYLLYDFQNEIYIGYILSVISIVLFFISIDFKIKYLALPYKLIKNKNVRSNIINNDVLENNFENDKNKDQVVQPPLPFQEKKVSSNDIAYKLPSLSILKKNLDKKFLEKSKSSDNTSNSDFLEKILLDFGIEGKIKRISNGPVVTLYEFEPAPGIKISKIINLSDDIARNTSSISTRVAALPGKNTIGIEIPNTKRENVYLSEIISDEKFSKKEIKLPISLGKSISGAPVVGDLVAMPHLLIAGTTGSGKSVCINTLILSLLYRHPPNMCKFILIDPKMLELSSYEGIPHLLCPVITEAKKATRALSWVVKEMENRYKRMSQEGVRNIDGFNQKMKNKMPFIVVIVDEMSDLMLMAGKEIESYIQKLSQMARAAGIHIIMATQRPSVDVITGTIKANFPTRISFQVSSKIDSRTILGEQGAEQLLGKGDFLFMSSANRIIRIHGPFVTESEIEEVSSFWRSQSEPKYIDEITSDSEDDDSSNSELSNDNKDQLYNEAVKLVKQERKASTSLLQRKLQIGYNRAARIIDKMEEEGIVSQANHVGKREILK